MAPVTVTIKRVIELMHGDEIRALIYRPREVKQIRPCAESPLNDAIEGVREVERSRRYYGNKERH